MIKFRNIIFLLPIITIFLVCCNQNSDVDLLNQIRSNITGLPVNVILTVANNQVYLEGLVESDSVSLAIENNFKDMHGVVSVKNNLKVIPALRKVSDL